ncbi:MAG TPA: oligosaccharide flippase family protein [Verrucomicrobiae bacterium]|nr:oligosaccharide flippase family protein [Verrucomicrobiae bacterium]
MATSKRAIFHNIVYAGLTKGTKLVCITLTSSIVARNLSPWDYGVIGFAAIIIGFLNHFSDIGIGSAAVRRASLTPPSLHTAFTLKIMLGCVAFLSAYLVAPFAHLFFQHPATGNVLRVLAFGFLINTLGFMPLVTLMREQNFRALMIPGMLSAIARCILVIVLIALGWSYWAVVLADVGATLVSVTAIQFVRKIPFAVSFDRADAREYLRFGLPLLASGVLVFLIFNLDNLLVGSAMGSAQLGYYALAFTWGSFICGVLYDSVNSVLLPAFAEIQHDLAAMRRGYLKILGFAGFVSVVANTALLANAHYFLTTFLGKGTDKWVPATVALEIFCFYGILRAVTEPIGSCIMALGQTKPLLHAALLSGGIEVLLLVLALRTRKIESVAAVVLLAYTIQVVVYLPFLRRNLSVTVRDIAGQLWPLIPTIAGAWLATSLLPASLGNTLITLAFRASFTALVAALVHGLCTRFRFFQEATGIIMKSVGASPGLAPRV